MQADQNSSKNDLTGKLKKGDLVRYGTGATALMIMETDRGDGFWSGPQCVGGQVTNSLSALIPTGFKDRRTWVMHAAFRKQTTDEAMAQIGYVVGEENSLDWLDTSPGSAGAQIAQIDDDNAQAQREFSNRFNEKIYSIDTPEELLAKAKLEIDSFDTICRKNDAICRKKFVDTPEAKRPEVHSEALDNLAYSQKMLLNYFLAGMATAALIGALVGATIAKLI
jgi:hypothetical protein